MLYLGSVVLTNSLLALFLNGWVAFALTVLFCLVLIRKVLPKHQKKVLESINKKYPLSFELVIPETKVDNTTLNEKLSQMKEQAQMKDVDNSPDMR